ncbi:MAG: sulfotransferase, partial [Gammaproteobacteria bacterium]|nr:sulfotransferase [Gammaproteobacteria bacterium]
REELTSAEVYQELVAKIDPLIAVEKSPAYTISSQRLERIYDTFPDARFIHLVRHPIPQSQSVMNLSDGIFALFVNAIEFHESHALLEPQIAWHDLNINILNFLEKIPATQQLRIKGEDIMVAPEEHLAKISRWLGIRDDAEAIAQMMQPEKSPFACFGPINALFGNDPNFLRGPAFRPHTPKIPSLYSAVPWRDDNQGLHPKVIALAKELGYD